MASGDNDGMPKPGKPPLVENIRPLAVFSVFWRVYESGWLRTEAFRKWRTHVGIEDVAWKDSTEAVAATMGNLFAAMKYLGALDYSKAYDYMSPGNSNN